MITVLQRTTAAKVTVGDRVTGENGTGLVILIGVTKAMRKRTQIISPIASRAFGFLMTTTAK